MLNTAWMMTNNERPRILLTSGEPAGIGPDLILKLNQNPHNYDLTLISDPNLLIDRAAQLAIPITISANSQQITIANNTLKLLPLPLAVPAVATSPDKRNASCMLEMLDRACKECLAGHFDAMVTNPLQKSVINEAGIAFSGHTEYIAQQCKQASPVMLLSAPNLRIALVTTHLPLRAVADAITTVRLEQVLRIVIKEFPLRFKIISPRITVCGLNPHAGENGYLGTEEEQYIKPVIKKLVAEGHEIVGPVSADTAFRTENRQTTDVFICMYHDQGLPIIKTLNFGNIVNITLGLPIIRTSVDHGTALQLAGTGQAQCDSLLAAIEMASHLAITQNT